MKPHCRDERTRVIWVLFALAVLVVPWGLASCGGHAAGGSASSESVSESEEPTELADGSYYCDVTNMTRSNGPYILDCEKSGDTITIHFPNGGHIDLDIDSQESTGEGSWEITATNAENGDSWDLSIDE